MTPLWLPPEKRFVDPSEKLFRFTPSGKAGCCTKPVWTAVAQDGEWRKNESTGEVADFNNLTPMPSIGIDSSNNSSANCYFRFEIHNVNSGDTVSSARIRFYPYDDGAGGFAGITINAKISVKLADDTLSPTSASECENDARSASPVLWNNIETWLVHLRPPYYTPDLTSLVQEIIDRPGWVSANSILFYVQNNGSTADNWWYVYRKINGNLGEIAYRPQLELEVES